MVACKSLEGQALPVWIKESPQGAVASIHAQPGARRSGVVGEHGTSLKIALTAPPVEGKANAFLIKFLSGLMGMPKSRIRLVSGETSREKRILFEGKTAAETAAVLSRAN